MIETPLVVFRDHQGPGSVALPLPEVLRTMLPIAESLVAHARAGSVDAQRALAVIAQKVADPYVLDRGRAVISACLVQYVRERDRAAQAPQGRPVVGAVLDVEPEMAPAPESEAERRPDTIPAPAVAAEVVEVTHAQLEFCKHGCPSDAACGECVTEMRQARVRAGAPI